MVKPLSREAIMDILSTCLDPELGIDIVSLGLIYQIEIKPEMVNLTMTLTTPGCPLVPYFRQEIENKIKNVSQVKTVNINISFDPPWDPSKMSVAAKQQLTMMR